MHLLARIHNLSVEENLNDGLELCDGLRLTNDARKVESLLTDSLEESCGAMEARAMKASAVMHWSQPNEDDLAGEEEITQEMVEVYSAAGHRLLTTCLRSFNEVAMMLWVLEDNAVFVDTGYGEILVSATDVLQLHVSITPTLFSASGEQPTTKFSRDDLLKASELSRRWNAHLKKTVSEAEASADTLISRDSNGVLGSHKGSTRLSRFFHFLQIARSATDQGVRIALYFSALESLFTTDNKDIAHKVSDRVSCFIETDGEAREDTYRQMKRAYNVRSRVVHGSCLEAKAEEELFETSKRLDFFLRRVFGKMLDEARTLDQFDEPVELFSEYLRKLVNR